MQGCDPCSACDRKDLPTCNVHVQSTPAWGPEDEHTPQEQQGPQKHEFKYESIRINVQHGTPTLAY
jgi:hypothetical protein